MKFAFFALAALLSQSAMATTLECGSFMQDEITIEIFPGYASVYAPDIISRQARILPFKGDDGATASFAGDKNTAATGRPLISSLILKVPANVTKLSIGSKIEPSLVERYSERLSEPGVPFDWRPKCVVKKN